MPRGERGGSDYSGLGRVASLGIDLQVKPDDEARPRHRSSRATKKKGRAPLLSLAYLGRPRPGQRFWIYDPGDRERIDDRYTSRSHLTGVVHESDLRTDAIDEVVATAAEGAALFLYFSFSARRWE